MKNENREGCFLSNKMFFPIETDFQAAPYLQWTSDTWPILPLFIATAYIWFIFVVHHPHLRKTTVAIWDLILSLFSLCGAVRVVPAMLVQLRSNSFHQIFCLYPDYLDRGPVGMWSMLFVFSKVMELLDTVFLVWDNKPLIFLHWYHHLTVLLLSWHAYVSRSPISLHVMSMNYSIHTVMYAYYFLRTVGRWPRWLSPQFITTAQIAQMVVGSSLCAAGLIYKLNYPQCHAPTSNLVFAAIIYSSYFCLFIQFFSKRFPKKIR